MRRPLRCVRQSNSNVVSIHIHDTMVDSLNAVEQRLCCWWILNTFNLRGILFNCYCISRICLHYDSLTSYWSCSIVVASSSCSVVASSSCSVVASCWSFLCSTATQSYLNIISVNVSAMENPPYLIVESSWYCSVCSFFPMVAKNPSLDWAWVNRHGIVISHSMKQKVVYHLLVSWFYQE